MAKKTTSAGSGPFSHEKPHEKTKSLIPHSGGHEIQRVAGGKVPSGGLKGQGSMPHTTGGARGVGSKGTSRGAIKSSKGN